MSFCLGSIRGWNYLCSDPEESEIICGIKLLEHGLSLIHQVVEKSTVLDCGSIVQGWLDRHLFCILLFAFIKILNTDFFLTPSLFTTIVPITPLWLTSRFRVSSTSDAIFLKYQYLCNLLQDIAEIQRNLLTEEIVISFGLADFNFSCACRGLPTPTDSLWKHYFTVKICQRC